MGPTLSFRGIDNLAYYRLRPRTSASTRTSPAAATRSTCATRRVLQLVVDSLRYWVTEMHVDGFRFDLATTLARDSPRLRRAAARFFDVLRPGPGALAPCKLIAEPWDLGDGGYQVGSFPPGWSEWNDQYRDTMRAYWKGDGGLIGDFARRLTGSHDLYGTNDARPVRERELHHRARRLHAARPGLVQREAQRGQRRGEPRRQHQQPLVELRRRRARPTTPRSTQLRERQKRNFLATLLLSQGVPMLARAATRWAARRAATTTPTARTTSSPGSTGTGTSAEWTLLDFMKHADRALRREHPDLPPARVLPRRAGAATAAARTSRWLQPDGDEMTEDEWNNGLRAQPRRAAVRRRDPEDADERGQPLRDTSFLLLFNAHHDVVDFTLPDAGRWPGLVRRDRHGDRDRRAARAEWLPQGTYTLQGRSLVLLRQDACGSDEARRTPCRSARSSRRRRGPLPPVGAGGEARGDRLSERGRSRAPLAMARAADGWFQAVQPGLRRRHALRVSRRRPRPGARSRLALQSRWMRARPERARRSARLRLARRRSGAAARGTRPWSTSCTSAPSRREGTFRRRHRASSTTWWRLGVTRDRAHAASPTSPASATGATTACCRSRPTPPTARPRT